MNMGVLESQGNLDVLVGKDLRRLVCLGVPFLKCMSQITDQTLLSPLDPPQVSPEHHW